MCNAHTRKLQLAPLEGHSQPPRMHCTFPRLIACPLGGSHEPPRVHCALPRVPYQDRSPTWASPLRATLACLWCSVPPSSLLGMIPVIIASLVNGAVSLANARSGIVRICAALLTSEQRALPFPEQLAALEPLIEDRLALMGNAVADSVENNFAEDRSFGSGSGTTAGLQSTKEDSAVDIGTPTGEGLDDDVVRRATLMAGFCACQLTVSGLDIKTVLGRR